MDRLVNLRDVASASKGLVPGVLLRSDAPLLGDVHDYDSIGVAWPPATVVDLRDQVEVGDSHPLADEVPVLSFPVLDGAIGDPDAMHHTTLEEMYAAFVRAPSAAWLAKAITAVAVEATPVLVHCTAGKDRTGATVALALALVGVPREEILADYVLTHEAMPRVIDRMRRKYGLPPADPAEASPPGGLPDDLFTARAEAMASMLDLVEAYDGGVAGWFVASGGAPETIDALRSRLLA